ncbi:MAG: hypothetical protein ACOY0T_21400 [Myxococcota bacterium]
MVALLRILTGIAGLVFTAIGCNSPVPESHTSLVRSPGADPGKPSRPLSMVWLHHSTGDRLLKGGLLDALKQDGIAFHDINYEEAAVDGYVVGDHTDIDDWPKTFNTPKYFEVVKRWELTGDKPAHDIVMFKSCYPNSNIKNDAQLDEYKQHFNSLVPTFKAHPNILFIAMSTPPLVKKNTTVAAANRAREWSRWLTSEYAAGLPNVKVFDLFDALAIAEGNPDANTLAPQFATGRGDSHPSPEGARAVTRLFIPWLNRTARAAGLSD